MTEEDWLTAEHPYDMIYHKSCRDDRKRRLLVCACARLVLDLLPDEPFRSAVEFSERCAEGKTDNDEWKAIRGRLRKAHKQLELEPEFHASSAVYSTTEKEFMSFKMAIESASAARASSDRDRWDELHNDMTRAQCELVREVFPNPFRQVNVDPSWLSWNDGTVSKLVNTIVVEQCDNHFPILADALEEAGCDSREFLDHCRRKDGHVHGCWAIDLLLEEAVRLNL